MVNKDEAGCVCGLTSCLTLLSLTVDPHTIGIRSFFSGKMHRQIFLGYCVTGRR